MTTAAVVRRTERQAPVEAEDLARARWYLFLARLFREPPDGALLASVAADASAGVPDRTVATDGPAGDDPADRQAPLAAAWREFAAVASAARADSVRDEFEQVFLGVGRAPVPPNASFHLSGFLNERPLAELRGHLASLGLARRDDVGETEDHVASLCEVMAHLAAGDDVPDRLAVQRQFFDRFVAPWYERFADAIDGCETTDFYRAAARLLRRFLDVERLAFAFDA